MMTLGEICYTATEFRADAYAQHQYYSRTIHSDLDIQISVIIVILNIHTFTISRL